MRHNEFITLHNMDTKEFFFSTDHCQRLNSELTQDHWVPCTSSLPMFVAPRPGIEDGMIRSIRDYVNLFYRDDTLIMNPDPKFAISREDTMQAYLGRV